MNANDARRFSKLQRKMWMRYILHNHIYAINDCMILLEGRKGLGKSTAGAQFGKEWIRDFATPLLGYPEKFSFKKHVIYDDDVDDIRRVVRERPMYSPLVFDEGGRILLAEDWNKKENKNIKKLFAEIRTKQHIIIINSPFKINNIDKKYLDNFIHFWVHLWGKGYSTVFRQNLHPTMPGFDIEGIERRLPVTLSIAKSWKNMWYYHNRIKGHPNTFGVFCWRALGSAEYAEYQKFRDAAVYDTEPTAVESLHEKDKKLLKALDTLRAEGKKWADIAVMFGWKTGDAASEWYRRMSKRRLPRNPQNEAIL